MTSSPFASGRRSGYAFCSGYMSRRRDIQLLSMAAVLLAGAGLCLPDAAATPPQEPRPASAAAWLVRQLETTEWRAAYPAWRKKNAGARCRPFQGDGSSLFIADLWSYRCLSAFGPARVN